MFQNLSHSLLRSLINIQLVDIADTDYIYRNRQCFGKYFVIKLLALYCRKLLGIIKSAVNTSCGKITAAITNGPAKGPRPASSIPAIYCAP